MPPALGPTAKPDRAGTISVGVAATALSVATTWYYFKHHLILGYQDSFSHLEISRRVVDGLSPGIAQLGGVWLPVPHLLQAVLSWNSYLYRTGLAGAIVSMACYVVTTLMIYRLIRQFCPQRAAPAIAGAAVFATNVNVLYQQSTSMDELPFYAFTVIAIYYLVKWGQRRRPTSLLPAGIASMLAVLCRYEAWFLAGIYLLCVTAMALRLRYSWRDARGIAFSYAVFGVLIPVGGWFLYNLIIFGSPLNFAYGPDSSAAQMARRSTDVNVGNWSLTAKAYGYAVGSDAGLVVLALAALGLLAFLIRERFSARSMPVLGLLTIIPFFLVSLDIGAEPISAPSQIGLLNYRFGLVVMIPAAILIGYLVSSFSGRVMVPVAVAVVIAAGALSGVAFARHQVVLATEAGQDLDAQRFQIAAGNYLEQHTTGLILMNNVQNERVGFDVLDRTIYDGTRESGKNRWAAILENPANYGVQVIVMRLPNPADPPDIVYTDLHNSPALNAYRLAYQNQAYLIYSLPALD